MYVLKLEGWRLKNTIWKIYRFRKLNQDRELVYRKKKAERCFSKIKTKSCKEQHNNKRYDRTQ